MLQGLARERLGLVGAAVVLLFGLVALAAPLLTPYGPAELHLQDRFRAPSGQYPFGTDEFGRDILSRVIYGTRISLGVGLGTMVLLEVTPARNRGLANAALAVPFLAGIALTLAGIGSYPVGSGLTCVGA